MFSFANVIAVQDVRVKVIAGDGVFWGSQLQLVVQTGDDRHCTVTVVADYQEQPIRQMAASLSQLVGCPFETVKG